jgi:hypothetical protein
MKIMPGEALAHGIPGVAYASVVAVQPGSLAAIHVQGPFKRGGQSGGHLM